MAEEEPTPLPASPEPVPAAECRQAEPLVLEQPEATPAATDTAGTAPASASAAAVAGDDSAGASASAGATASAAPPPPSALWDGAGDSAYVGYGFSVTRELVREGIAYFAANPVRTNKIQLKMIEVEEVLRRLEPTAAQLAAVAPRYDFDPALPGNGIRSILLVISKCIINVQGACRDCSKWREGTFFLADAVFNRLADMAECLRFLHVVAQTALDLAAASPDSLLMSSSHELVPHLVHRLDSTDNSRFFGVRAGLQYDQVQQQAMQLVLVTMAGYSDGYAEYRNKIAQTVKSMFSIGKYLVSPNERAQKLVAIFRSLDNARFVKAFWNLIDTTMLRHMPQLTGPVLAVNRMLFVPDTVLHLPPAFPTVDDIRLPIIPGVVSRTGELHYQWLLAQPRPTAEDAAAEGRAEAAGEAVDEQAASKVDAAAAPAAVPQAEAQAKQADSPAAASAAGDVPAPAPAPATHRDRAQRLPPSPFPSKAAVELLQELSERLLSATTPEALAKHGQQIKAALSERADSLTPEETALCQGSLFQLYEQRVGTLKRKEAFHAQEAATAASSGQGSASASAKTAGMTWKERAGRRTGDADYQMFDGALAMLSMLNFGVKTPGSALSLQDLRQMDPVMQDAVLMRFGLVQVRLLSFNGHQGQVFRATDPAGARDGAPRTPGLLIHFHGGGFIANTSRSHEIYLRSWARSLQMPILSVDYALAPECPFPRAIHECMQAYAWAVANAHKLGSTGQRICVAGDSAGGNLAVALTLRCLLEGIRPPDAVLAFYPALLVDHAISPSRMLSYIDPLLNHGVLRMCLESYRGRKGPSSAGRSADPLMSPLLAADSLLARFPPCFLVGCSLDPLLDDTITFARRLRAANRFVSLSLVHDVPHGFLNFKDLTGATVHAHGICLRMVRTAFGLPLEEEEEEAAASPAGQDNPAAAADSAK